MSSRANRTALLFENRADAVGHIEGESRGVALCGADAHPLVETGRAERPDLDVCPLCEAAEDGFEDHNDGECPECGLHVAQRDVEPREARRQVLDHLMADDCSEFRLEA